MRARGFWLNRACSRFNCTSLLHHAICLHLFRINPNTRATIFRSAKANKSVHGKIGRTCPAIPFVRLVQIPRPSARIPIASRQLLLLSKKTNAPCSVPLTIPTLRMYPRGVGISATIRPSDVDVCPQKWLADLVMLVAGMNILASSRPPCCPLHEYPCKVAPVCCPRSGGTLV